MRFRTEGRLVVLGLVFVIAGCSQPGAKSSAGPTPVTGGATASTGPAVAGTLTLNKEFWYGGFHVTLGRVQYAPAPRPTPGGFASQVPGKLMIEAKFENLGTDTSAYRADMSLAVGSNQYADVDGEDQKLPNVPGKQTGDGVIAFQVDNKFELAHAVLTVGNAKTNQATIPFGSDGQLVSLAPIKVVITGSLTLQGLYKLDITGGDLSYDKLSNHQEEDAGNQQLIVHFSRTALTDTCCISANQFSLKLPDGTAVAADNLEECCSIGTTGTTKPDQLVTFIFKKADGNYDLIGKEKVHEVVEQANIPFTITNGTGGGASPGLGSSPGAGASPSASSGSAPNPTPSGH